MSDETTANLISELDQVRSRNVRIICLAMESLTDGEALGLPNTYGALLRLLMPHVGERGASEGAAETLERIIRERDEALRRLKSST